MPPEDRFVTRFAAEPPQDALPSGRWADTLTAEFLEACLRINTDGEDLGEAGVPTWYPDRTWNGRTYVPVTARTTTNLEVFGYVSFLRATRTASARSRSPATSPPAPTSPTSWPRAIPTGAWTCATR